MTDPERDAYTKALADLRAENEALKAKLEILRKAGAFGPAAMNDAAKARRARERETGER
jgi:hypothetical protein